MLSDEQLAEIRRDLESDYVMANHGLSRVREHGWRMLAEVERLRKSAMELLLWAADELDAQAEAHGVSMIDYSDHLRCFTEQPERESMVPWPASVARPRSMWTVEPVDGGFIVARTVEDPRYPAIGVIRRREVAEAVRRSMETNEVETK